jgi:hypothetical protein
LQIEEHARRDFIPVSNEIGAANRDAAGGKRGGIKRTNSGLDK